MNRGFDRAHYRIFPIDPKLTYSYPLLNMMYGISVINDYTPMWLKRYQSITGFQLNGAAPVELLSHPELLSLIGAQYLFAQNPVTIEAVREVVKPTGVGARSLPLAPLTCAALQCVGAAFSGTTISLVSPGGAGVAIVNFPIELHPSTNYEISFDVDAIRSPPTPLSVNLYAYKPGSIYDNPGQYRSVVDITKTPIRHTLWINSGPTAPQHAFLRLYTQSQVAIEIGNVQIAEATRSFPAVYPEAFRTRGGIVVFRNPHALPRFRFATKGIPALTFERAEGVLLDPDFDGSTQAVVEGLGRKVDFSSGRIVSEDIHNNLMRWTVETGARSLFVVADSLFPGWKAKVDGRPVEIRMVDGFLRGVFIAGSGKHSVEMRFWPASLTYGLAVTVCAVIAALLIALKHRMRD